MYFDIGIPEGNDLLNANLTMSLKPESISPKSGSAAGTLLTLDVPGALKNQQGLKLVDQDKTDLCTTVTVPEQGKLQCMTKNVEIAEDTQLQLMNGEELIPCSSLDSCKYK